MRIWLRPTGSQFRNFYFLLFYSGEKKDILYIYPLPSDRKTSSNVIEPRPKRGSTERLCGKKSLDGVSTLKFNVEYTSLYVCEKKKKNGNILSADSSAVHFWLFCPHPLSFFLPISSCLTIGTYFFVIPYDQGPRKSIIYTYISCTFICRVRSGTQRVGRTIPYVRHLEFPANILQPPPTNARQIK